MSRPIEDNSALILRECHDTGKATHKPLCLQVTYPHYLVARPSIDSDDPSNHTLLTHRLLLVTLPASMESAAMTWYGDGGLKTI